MVQNLLKKYFPHILAVLIFLIVSIVYCKPALQGMVLQQHDITHWKGAIRQSEVFKELHGNMPLWTNSVFSGMPAFQIGTESNNVIPGYVQKFLTLGFDSPVQFFLLASICFYFLCIVLRTNPYIGIISALGFAYATYNVIIISVGHDTKMWSIAYMPALLASVLLIYQHRKYWLGTALTALFTATMLAMNHPQIDYYFFIAAAIMSIFFIAHWIRNKDLRHMAMALSLTVVGALAGVATNAVNLLSTYEFQKETIRGGSSELSGKQKSKAGKTNGLDKDYAFDYSMAIPEPLVMLFPRMYGGSNSSYPEAIGGQGYREMKDDDSKALEAFRQMPQELAQQMVSSLALYWGGIGATSGPPYVGAVICFLAILSIFLLKGVNRWWPWVAISLAIIMSWGQYFPSFNDIMFNILPLYNKFRAPSMILVIPQFLLSFLSALALQEILSRTDRASIIPDLKKGLMATGALILLALAMYATLPFLSKQDTEVLKQVSQMNRPEISTPVKTFFDALKEDRKSMMLGDIFRALVFIGIATAVVFGLIRKKISPTLGIAGLGLLILIDLLSIDSKYLNESNYEERTDAPPVFALTPLDQEILNDKGFFRVFNVGGSEAFNENITSYHFNSAGGYTAVKLRIYQDLIENRLFPEQSLVVQALQKNPDSLPPIPTLNMLNVRYFIYKENNQTKMKWRNPGALGNAWFVDSLRLSGSADETMAAIGNIDPSKTAVVLSDAKLDLPAYTAPDTTASIELVKNENDHIVYRSRSKKQKFTVFSEIYYKAGWIASIDGKQVPIHRTNYVLRGINVPPGEHEIRFDFEPEGYKQGHSITSISSIVVLLLLAAGIFMEWRSRKKEINA